MANAHPPPLNPAECREPTVEDLIKLCRALNNAGARYLVIGGFAIRAAGYIRDTMGVDLLVETGPENERRVIRGLMSLPSQAAMEIKAGEIDQFGVVRVADEILVDLMKSGCGITYADAIPDAVWKEMDGVRIPFASPQILWRMKQTRRERDIPDRLFLQQLLQEQGASSKLPETESKKPGEFRDWLRRILGNQ